MSAQARLRAALLTPLGLTSLVILTAVAFLVAFAPLLWGDKADTIDVAGAGAGLSREHPLGTDALGRDLLARVLVATRSSIVLAVLATLLAAAIGIPAGALPVLFGRRVQRGAAAAIGLLAAFPAVLLALFTIAIVGIGARGAVLGIGIASAPVFARLAQTLTATIAGSDFLAASRLLGVPRRRLLTRHVLPNIAEPLVLNVSLAVGGALLAISALSFLGLGVQPPGYDWGRLMQEGLPRIYTTPSNALAPALAIVLTGVGFSLAGEAIAGYVGRRSAAPPHRRSAPAADRTAVVPPVAPSGSDAGDQDAVLRVRDLSVRFDTPTGPVSPVRGVDLTIRPGEIVGIVGESGSGKSLTALALADLLPHPGRLEAGELTFLGQSLLELSARERAALLGTSLAMIYQNPMSSMNPLLRVGRQLSEVAEVHGGLTRADARARAVDRLRKVRIPNAARRMGQYPHEFSGGMRQRAMIAMGLMVSPKLIIADEPTTALDVTVQQQVLTLLRDVSSSTGAAVLFISHDLAVVSQLCSRVLVMYAGRIVEELDIETLHSAPAHPYTRALMASLPSMELPRDRVLESIPGRPPDPASLPTGCPFAPRCAHATDRSHQVEPALEPLDRPGHRVACHTPRRSDLGLTSAAGSR